MNKPRSTRERQRATTDTNSRATTFVFGVMAHGSARRACVAEQQMRVVLAAQSGSDWACAGGAPHR